MASPPWLDRIAAITGPVSRVRALSGDAWLVTAGETSLVAKHGPGCADEAEGLRRLAEVAGAPPVPDVVLADDDLLVTAAVEQATRTRGHDEDLGRSLARLHGAPWPEWGGGSKCIGRCPVDGASSRSAAAFYGARLRELAGRCGLDRAVDPVADRLEDLLPPGRPALVHGDLWWGNVLFGADGRAWLIDPSVHGGHPEEDLAMLGLFGVVPDRLLRAYEEVRPLRPGWEDRVALFQLYPLLVHAVLFGGGYRAQALEVARRYA
jgi:fructosamine-3-kinase